MLNVIPPWARLVGLALVVSLVFASGMKAASWYWSGKFERLKASHALAIEKQRKRLLEFQDEVNEATLTRERNLLRQIEIQRERYAQLESEINSTPLVRTRVITERPDCPPVDDIDWAAFGRLFDAAAARGPTAEVESPGGSDATSGESTDTR